MSDAEGDQPIRPDRIVDRWRGGSTEPPRLIRFDGFVGGETEDGRVLLYDPDDSSHVIQIPRNAIRVIEPEDPALTPVQGTALWIDPDAECLHIVPDVGPESFLAGEIAQGAYGLLLDESGILKCDKWKSFSKH
jgi:hypothetical protein